MGTPLDRWVVGIDLGTTNTSAVVFGPDGTGPLSILHDRGATAMPSIVSLKNPLLPRIGWPAKEMLLTDPLTTIFGWKRLIGRSERSEYVSRYRDRFPFPIGSSPSGELGAMAHGRVVPFTDIAALILDQVRLQTSAAVQKDVRQAVIAVPANFSTAQRAAVEQAAARAGLEVLRLVNEPTAAALAFGGGRQLESRIVVYDFGGGTFDTTLLELTGTIFDVKATRGDAFLGGLDVDRALMRRLAEVARADLGVEIAEHPVIAQRLLSAAENAKMALSEEPAVHIHIPALNMDSGRARYDLEYRMTRDELERLTAPLIERTIGVTEEMMVSAGFSARDIHNVVLVGGQSRMPLVRRRLEEVFGRPPLGHLDPNTVVAHGAALVARSSQDLTGDVLLDVLSVPIGVVFPGGATRVVFGANRPLPAEERLPIERPPAGRPAIVGLWQGLEVTSGDRHNLGLFRVPPECFSGGAGFALDLKLNEDLSVSGSLIVDGRTTVALTLEDARKAP